MNLLTLYLVRSHNWHMVVVVISWGSEESCYLLVQAQLSVHHQDVKMLNEMKIRLGDILYIVLSSLLMVILLFHSSFRIRGRYEVNITVWCYMHCLFLWLSFGEWGRLFVSHSSLHGSVWMKELLTSFHTQAIVLELHIMPEGHGGWKCYCGCFECMGCLGIQSCHYVKHYLVDMGIQVQAIPQWTY